MKAQFVLWMVGAIALATFPGRRLHAATALPEAVPALPEPALSAPAPLPPAPAEAVVAADGTQHLVYVIPIEGMIERGLIYVIRRGVGEAERRKADAIIFVMDTPGGQLQAAEEIINIIASVNVPTYTYVNPNAISAGAIIALATDKIYMAPGSRIGDAMPIMMSPMGGAQPMPEDIKEKIMSYTAGLVRSAAQRKGHDDRLAESMVRPEIEYKIGEDIISKAGELLTLTNAEAERYVGQGTDRRRLLSSGTVNSLDGLLATIGVPDAAIQRMVVSPLETVARYIEMFSWLLLAGGVLGIFVEIKTPGFGVPGILGGLLLAVWFWGHHIAGFAGMEEALIFLIGMVLLLVEIFVIPGFGFVGLTGLMLMALGMLMAMVQHYPGTPTFHIPSLQVEGLLWNLGLATCTAFLAGLLLVRFLPKTTAYSHLVLSAEERADQGYRVASQTELVGQQGTAGTPLRPAGIGVFGARRVNVVARGAFIEQGTPIVVAETHGARVVVDAQRNTEPGAAPDAQV
jgi:membrane-bound serine protease (ClpP class)